MRTLLLLLAFVMPVQAQVVTSHLILPSYGGSYSAAWSTTTPNEMRCFRFSARLGITNATKMAAGIQVGNGTGGICGWAIYADGAAGARLASMSVGCATALIVLQTGMTPFSLVQGTTYRFCTCSSKAAGSYLSVYDQQGQKNTSVSPAQSELLNASGTLRAASATNPCVVGVPPLTTGVLVTATLRPPPFFLLEN